jgi:beta-glucanase (GH16 family)
VGTGWGNQQLEYDTDRTENAALDGQGNLAITARREAWLGSAYTSARLVTKGKVSRKYGRVEARIRLPAGQGLWPAFWLLGENIDEVGWPACGEIDVMEYRGQEPSVAMGSLHGPGYSGGASVTRSYLLPGGAGFDQDFHVFSVEWDDGLITWQVDGDTYHSARRGEVSGDWPFDQPFYVILNLAVGGTFVGPPNASTAFPATMLVDWVRIHERE